MEIISFEKNLIKKWKNIVGHSWGIRVITKTLRQKIDFLGATINEADLLSVFAIHRTTLRSLIKASPMVERCPRGYRLTNDGMMAVNDLLFLADSTAYGEAKEARSIVLARRSKSHPPDEPVDSDPTEDLQMLNALRGYQSLHTFLLSIFHQHFPGESSWVSFRITPSKLTFLCAHGKVDVPLADLVAQWKVIEKR